MGSINFAKGQFADHLHEIMGYKSGLAASIEWRNAVLVVRQHDPYFDPLLRLT